ncbi:hypothetical protein DVH24_028118 [Malus domestica]|uniref:Uncharacterized protein n=1 Tax=Malus domestica TaxID=3750 RepID=A0A498HFQ8_MALDO|nr:hypothetical protein DVH24_028118 [Malus domestica]
MLNTCFKAWIDFISQISLIVVRFLEAVGLATDVKLSTETQKNRSALMLTSNNDHISNEKNSTQKSTMESFEVNGKFFMSRTANCCCFLPSS